MARVIRLHRHGGPEVLALETVAEAPPRAHEIRIRQTAIGVNFTDVHGRRGDYAELAAAPKPVGIGIEGVGVVEALGADVTRFKPGDRVAYASRPLGAYADARNYPADLCVKVPDGLADEIVAASFLKGMTVEYLIRRTYPVQAGDYVVFHAAAGGVGSLAGQWLRALGAHAIGIVGSPEKVATAKANGYTHVFVHGQEDWPARARSLTGGKGVPAVFDSVGQATWDGSIACLAPRGRMVCFGNSSGLVPPISVNTLRDRGSLWITWTRLGEYTATVAELEACASAFFDTLRRGVVKPHVQQTFALAQAAHAHRLLESRGTTGSLVLIP
jgi:NADPH2:quinone reductase